MAKHHVIISGTGRAGTTLLVQLLTRLGLDTGFDSPTSQIFPNCNAGMEVDIRRPDAPYIVKSPWLCDYLEEVVRDGERVIDHAIIPIRELSAAAESRREVSRKAPSDAGLNQVPGGLWHTTSFDQQETVLAGQLYKLLWAVAALDIPITLLAFPKLTTDPEYLYGKLGFLMPNIEYARFLEAFHQLSRPDLVHDFRSNHKI